MPSAHSLQPFQTKTCIRVIFLETMMGIRQADGVAFFICILAIAEGATIINTLREICRTGNARRATRGNVSVLFVSGRVCGVCIHGNQQLTTRILEYRSSMLNVCSEEHTSVFKWKCKQLIKWLVLTTKCKVFTSNNLVNKCEMSELTPTKCKVFKTRNLAYSNRKISHFNDNRKHSCTTNNRTVYCILCECLRSGIDTYCRRNKQLLKEAFFRTKTVKKILKRQHIEMAQLCTRCNPSLFYNPRSSKHFKLSFMEDILSCNLYLRVKQNITVCPLQGQTNPSPPSFGNFGQNDNANDRPHSINNINSSRYQPNQNQVQQENAEAMDYTDDTSVSSGGEQRSQFVNNRHDCPSIQLHTSQYDYPTVNHTAFLQNSPWETKYEDFNKRMASFVHWPARCSQTPLSLASSGLYHTGRGDLVVCFFCGIELKDWRADEDPDEKHLKGSPNCGYVTQKLGYNTTQQYKQRIQPCTDDGENTVRDFAGSTPSVSSLFNIQVNQPTIYPGDYARSPKYAAFDVRLSTFTKWPIDLPQRPPSLAEAGFYYTGVRDVVRCYVCDGGLQKWDPNDDPWVEHARWFPTCPYVLRVKGEEFVQLVSTSYEEPEEEVEAVVPNFQRWTAQSAASKQSETTTTYKEKLKESNEVLPVSALSVIEMGYSKKAVLMALDEVQKSNKTEPSAEVILSVLIEKEDAGEKLPTDSPLSSSPVQTEENNDKGNKQKDALTDHQQIVAEHEKLIKRVKCSDCRERDKNVLFLPCTHFELCEQCAADVFVCPQCWREIKQKVKTYMS